MIKKFARIILNSFGFGIYRLSSSTLNNPQIPDGQYYQPLFSPWLGFGEFSTYYDMAKAHSLVSPDRCWVLYCLCQQALFLKGDIWECGVYKGGTAAMLAQIITDYSPKGHLHLFDTFEGMPETDCKIDLHRKGDFSDTSLDAVKNYVKHSDVTFYHKGFIPDTFRGLEDNNISLAHIDVDIKQSVTDCCEFIFPRLTSGGFIIFDDYGFPSCPGARQAVDAYFLGKEIIPLVLPTGQAIIFKSK